MVLDALGMSKTEEELRDLCDCLGVPGAEGTWALSLIDAARRLGFANSRKYTMDFQGLSAEVQRGMFPIAYVYTQLSADQPPQPHAVVVVETRETFVTVNDPWRGEYVFSKERFIEEWQRMNGLTILVE